VTNGQYAGDDGTHDGYWGKRQGYAYLEACPLSATRHTTTSRHHFVAKEGPAGTGKIKDWVMIWG
jgi:hypothetical protein